MKRKQNLAVTAAVVGFIVLILDSKTAVTGAQSGIVLCLKTVIPSLFPFFVVSIMLTDCMPDRSGGIMKTAAELMRIPDSAATVLIPAFLGGYPAGAQCIGILYSQKRIDQPQAQRMLAFCNNAGPSFLFGMLSGAFTEIWMVWALWFIHILSAILTAWVFPVPISDHHPGYIGWNTAESSVVTRASRVMMTVCSWVVLFRTAIGFLQKWFLWLLPLPLQILVIGMLELTNGCSFLYLLDDLPVRFIICSCLLGFGGCCVMLQTASVIGELPLRTYFYGKVMQTGFSFLLSSAILPGHGITCTLLTVVLVLILRKVSKKYSFSELVPV